MTGNPTDSGEPGVDRESGDGRDTVRAMTFNVRYDTEADGERSWDDRKEMVASVVRFHRPDVVGVQETLKHQYDYLREHLPEYAWVGVGREDGDAEGEFGPVGYRQTRFECVDESTFWLSETPDVPGSTDWGSDCPRMVTWVELRDRTTDDRIFHFNTHFDHRSALARERGAALLRERVAALAGDAPAVVTGDLNCTESSRTYALLTGEERDTAREEKSTAAEDDGAADADGPDGYTGSSRRPDLRGVDGDRIEQASTARPALDAIPGEPLADARYAATHGHHGPTATFDWFEGTPDVKIDYVFVSEGADVNQHGVLCDRWDGGVPSDHRPVLAELSFD